MRFVKVISVGIATIIFVCSVSCIKRHLVDSQEARTSYCTHVLRPKVCELVVERGEFDDTTSCQEELSVYGFCHEPITVSINDMKKCVDGMVHSTYLPDECLAVSNVIQ